MHKWCVVLHKCCIVLVLRLVVRHLLCLLCALTNSTRLPAQVMPPESRAAVAAALEVYYNRSRHQEQCRLSRISSNAVAYHAVCQSLTHWLKLRWSILHTAYTMSIAATLLVFKGFHLLVRVQSFCLQTCRKSKSPQIEIAYLAAGHTTPLSTSFTLNDQLKQKFTN